MEYLIKYWSQVAVILGLLGYVLKTIFDYRIRNKELRNKYFYELKAQKIIELHSVLVDIKILIDRRLYGEEFHHEVFTRRIALDKYYWESQLYFSQNTQKAFQLFMEGVSYYEIKNFEKEYPNMENDYEKFSKLLLEEFKNEIK